MFATWIPNGPSGFVLEVSTPKIGLGSIVFGKVKELSSYGYLSILSIYSKIGNQGATNSFSTT